jgi:hypothetical protein
LKRFGWREVARAKQAALVELKCQGAKDHSPTIEPGNVRLFDCNEQRPISVTKKSVLAGIISPALPLLRNGKVI